MGREAPTHCLVEKAGISTGCGLCETDRLRSQRKYRGLWAANRSNQKQSNGSTTLMFTEVLCTPETTAVTSRNWLPCNC